MRQIICVFSDESGVFNRNNNRFFVFGGLILNASNGEVGKISRLYSRIENDLRKKKRYADLDELKASSLAPQNRRALYSALRPFRKFGIPIDLDCIHPKVFRNKRTCQRYQDYAYSEGLASAFSCLISNGFLSYEEETAIHIISDEHHTATDGEYELREILMQTLKDGGFNHDFTVFLSPIFRRAEKVSLALVDSKRNVLARAADIIANRVYFEVNKGNAENIIDESMMLFAFPLQ